MDVRFRFYYCGIRVRDLKKSLDFYTKVIGMKVVNKGTMPHGGNGSTCEARAPSRRSS